MTQFLKSFQQQRSHFKLTWYFVKKDILLRYRGSVLGGTWAILSPLIMLGLYTFVFQYIFKSRWVNEINGHFDFALNLYAGLLIFNWFAECASRAPRLILEQPYLVNKVVFPLPVLGWAAVMTAGVQMFLSLCLLLLAALISGYPMTPYMLLTPWVPLLLLPWLLSVVWLLSGLGVFLRDLSQILPMIVTCVMFCSPIFYPVKALPERIQFLAYLNPLTWGIELLRDLIFNPLSVDAWGLIFCFLIGSICAWLSYKIFHRLSYHFADVL